MYLLQDDQRQNSPNVLTPITVDGLPTAEKLSELGGDEVVVCEFDGGPFGKAVLVCQTIGEMQFLHQLCEAGYALRLQWFRASFVKGAGRISG